MGQIQHISIRCAVILTAEIDRLRRVSGVQLIYSGKPTGAEDVTAILAELGCFELCDIEVDLGIVNQMTSRQTLIKIISGRSIEEDKFEEFEDALKAVFEGYHTIPAIHEGMGEALVNVRQHAYPDRQELRFLCPGKRWWATACVDKLKDEVRIFVFDQGVGIPATLPLSKFWDQILGVGDSLRRMVGGKSIEYSHDDGFMLRCAFEYARSSDHSQSSTGEQGRGYGFLDIMSAIDTYNVGLLRVASGRGQVTYAAGRTIEVATFPQHIGGTLIEWTLPMHVFK